MKNNWEIYDALIDGLPADLTVDECIIGLNWTYVRSGEKAGIAMTYRGCSSTGLADGPYIGRSLRDAAAGMKSWDLLQASVGVAACNAWYNDREKLSLIPEQSGGIFNEPLESILGRKVAVIGHFPYVEKQLGGRCELSVLERDPDEGDYLDSACEYILPDQDFVFITGTALTNKTLPRLLTLTENARTILVGPSSPMTSILFPFGVDSVAGFYVSDADLARSLVSQAAHLEIFKCGKRITFS